jgi:transcriptional regulator with XRE-family HTH domain
VPTLRAQWLGKVLRDLRESKGLTLRDAGDHIMRDASTISRIEAGTVPARLPDVLELMNLYNVDDPTLRVGLEQLSQDIWRKGWWDGYADSVPDRVLDAAWLESRADHIRDFALAVLPGLMQTPEYAEAVLQAAEPGASNEELQRWVGFRVRRQEVLTRDDPPNYTAILDESCLLRIVGNPAVMRDQLAHLLELSHQPHVAVRILPLSIGAPPSPEGGFTVFDLPVPFPSVTQINSEAGAIYLEMPKAGRFLAAYTRLERNALDVEETRTFVKTRMEQLA